MKQVVLKSTGEQVYPLGKYADSPLNAPNGYTDVVIPRKGMKNGRKSVCERVRNANLITRKV